MAGVRKSYQGIYNVVRFNWHFYVLSSGVVLLLFTSSHYVNEPFLLCINMLLIVVLATTCISLLISFYIYDLSGLYTLSWLDNQTEKRTIILNINAGFDETSALLENKYVGAQLLVFDFYDPLLHTEISIKRARKAYPPHPDTKQVKTTALPLQDNTADKIFALLSAHEIRDEQEKISFFKELCRVVKSTGEIIITEHLRDTPNFLAYNIGFFHFYSKTSWIKTFDAAGLQLHKEIKITPFITTFILRKNGHLS